MPAADTITVLLCVAPEGCEAEALAMIAHHAAIRRPLLGFDDVATAGPGGEEALRRWTAVEPAYHPEAGVEALANLPFTVSTVDLAAFWLLVATGRRIEGDAPATAEAIAAAASVAALAPAPMGFSPTIVSMYEAAVARAPRQPVIVTIDADAPAARVFVDGVDVGAAPASVAVLPGWHRFTVERLGRRTAWVAETVVTDAIALHAEVAMDDAVPALQFAVEGAIHGVEPTPDVTAAFARWATGHGYDRVRFVELTEDGPGEETVTAGRSSWYVQPAYLDVATGAWSTAGPGTGAPRPIRVHAGATVGYSRLGGRDHLAITVPIDFRITDHAGVALGIAMLRTPEPYLLYRNVLTHEVLPISLGARFGAWDGGPYATVGAVAVVPWAWGARVAGGVEIRATRALRWRIEVDGELTDRAIGAGASFGVIARP